MLGSYICLTIMACHNSWLAAPGAAAFVAALGQRACAMGPGAWTGPMAPAAPVIQSENLISGFWLSVLYGKFKIISEVM